MRNAIKYYYNINAKDIHQKEKNYKFYDEEYGESYLLNQYLDDPKRIEEILKIYQYIKQRGLYCHEIIANRNNEILTNINGVNYVLLKTKTNNRNINFNDIFYFMKNYSINLTFAESNFKLKDWVNLWQTKTDYTEYQINQFSKKYQKINLTGPYYLGLAETAISYLKYNMSINKQISISHKRIDSKYTINDLYNPIELIIDYRVRDIVEYIKSCFFNDDNVAFNLDALLLEPSEAIYFVSRMIYPTYYFDIIQNIIDGNITEDRLNNIINKIDKYEKYLLVVMNEYNKKYNIEKIEWIK